ncbi:aldose 1-epimerase [Cricetibacter osteomyelitidis]|uniref:Aldose 1-epimerase n=1 Tax=Cricetibacter osteomyelitidis TaxID=1521931 RepID=A0A4R2SVJ2_9PAST|nr:galactose-1-epimerase [Cricetibacter osteomyelitidis]TCP93305.1 aldose 1-epimerase [Cricetibacter osteomyelitidis]
MLTQMGIAPDGQPFNIAVLRNAQGMSVRFMDWGATWISCKLPISGAERKREVLLGCKIEDFVTQQAFLGATIGRYANRIANSKFSLNGKTCSLTANQGKHQLHGGPDGFDKRRWEIEKCGENFVIFSLFSADGDQGFPGNVQAKATYRLTDDNAVIAEFEAVSDQDTPLNLTNHAYFNLQNAEAGTNVREHQLQLEADYYLPVDSEGIPNAPLKSVQNTSFDFRAGKTIGKDFLQGDQQITKGYDHAFLLNEPQKTAAILTAPDSSLTLTVSTSQAALQVYSGNFVGKTPTRQGGEYQDYSGIALETQALPDTPNHPEWFQYGGIVKAGETYRQWTKFAFA